MDQLEAIESFPKTSYSKTTVAEVVGPGHADAMSAILSLEATRVLEEVAGQTGMAQVPRHDLKAGIGGQELEEHGYFSPVITLAGNIEDRPEFGRGGIDQVVSLMGQRLTERAAQIGFSLSNTVLDMPLDSRVRVDGTDFRPAISVQSSELASNATSGNRNQETLPQVFGDGGNFVGYAVNANDELVPPAVLFARQINEGLNGLVEQGIIRGGYDQKVHAIVGSNYAGHHPSQHAPIDLAIVKQFDRFRADGSPQTQDYVTSAVRNMLSERGLIVSHTNVTVNTAGPWHEGGPINDMGTDCDHIFWANQGAYKQGDPQVGEDRSKTDNVEFWARALAKTAVEALRDYGVHEAVVYAHAHIGRPALSNVVLELYREDGTAFGSSAQWGNIRDGLLEAKFPDSEEYVFPVQAPKIMEKFWAGAQTMQDYIMRGNIYGYSGRDSIALPWENTMRRTNAVMPYIREAASMVRLPIAATGIGNAAGG